MNIKMDPMGRAIADYYKDKTMVSTNRQASKLYIDADTLKEKAWRSGYTVEVVAEGEHHDYLAKITMKT